MYRSGSRPDSDGARRSPGKHLISSPFPRGPLGARVHNRPSLAASMRILGFVLLSVLMGAMPAAAQTAAAQPPTDQITFHKDIEPILQRSCQRCHNPESIAPMSLITYEQVRPFARAMKQRTALARS